MDTPPQKDLIFEKEFLSIKRTLTKNLKRSERQCQKCLEDLKINLCWQEIQHEAELLQGNYPMLKRGMTQVSLWDWKIEKECVIALNPKFTPQDEIALRYKTSKKLRKGLPYIESRLKQQTEALLKAQEWLNALEKIQDLSTLTVWRANIPLTNNTQPLPNQKKKSAPIEERQPYFEYTSASGLKIWVGKKASDNEKLTFSLSKGSDWWLHVAGLPGSHVIIRTHKGKDPDDESIQDAIQLALYYSKAKERGEGEVCLTQRKNVSRFGKGHVGKVQISKHKTYYARIEPKRFQELKSREKEV